MASRKVTGSAASSLVTALVFFDPAGAIASTDFNSAPTSALTPWARRLEYFQSMLIHGRTGKVVRTFFGLFLGIET